MSLLIDLSPSVKCQDSGGFAFRQPYDVQITSIRHAIFRRSLHHLPNKPGRNFAYIEMFNLFGLPVELRISIDEFYFAASVNTDYDLLFFNSPDNALLATSKSVYKEMISTFKAVAHKHNLAQVQLFELIASAVSNRQQTEKLRPRLLRYTEDSGRLIQYLDANAVTMALLHGGPEPWDYERRTSGPIGICGCDFTRPFIVSGCHACMYFIRLALYLAAFPERRIDLFSAKGNGELNQVGEEVQRYLSTTKFGYETAFECTRSFAVEVMSWEFERQEYVDLRCKIRFDAVMEYYRRCEPWNAEFLEWRILSIEKESFWPQLKAFEEFNETYHDSELEWRNVYEERASKIRQMWKEEGARVYKLVPLSGSM